jgi:hypothetical protein
MASLRALQKLYHRRFGRPAPDERLHDALVAKYQERFGHLPRWVRQSDGQRANDILLMASLVEGTDHVGAYFGGVEV